MRFNTHYRTPKNKTKKSIKIMLTIGYSLITAVFLFMAVVCSLYIRSIMPAVIILVPVLIIAILISITHNDMDKAYVEIIDDVIIATDYYFGIKKEKIFFLRSIATAEILIGYSSQIRGYRYSNIGCTYIVFRDNSGKYMFKVMCVPETKQYFYKYLK